MNIFDKRIVEKSMKGLTPMGSDQAFPETEDNGSLNLNNIDFESEEVPVVSQAIDFESEEPIDFSSFTGREPPGIYMPKEQSLWDKFRSLIADPGMDKGKAANIVSLSEEFGISPSRAEEYYDQLGDLIFSGTYPTSRDVASGLMGAAVTTGIIFNPVATAIGVGTFMGLDELENYIISKVREDPYHFQGGQGLSDLFEAHGLSEDVIDLLDFMWKIPVAGGTTKFGRGIFGAITSRIKGSSNKAKFVNKVAEDIKTEGILPDEAALKNAEEFGVDKDQLLDAQKDKDAKVEPEVGDVENPLEVTRPTDAVPTYTFTSQKGHHYEKIGEKWYNSKGREVTNQYVIKAAEKKKVAFGEDEAVEERVVKDIEEKTGKRIEEVTEEEIDKYYTEKEGVEEAEPVRPTIKQSLTPEELEATELFYNRRIKELTDEEVELFLEDYRTRAPATEGSFLQDEAMMEAEKAKFADQGRKRSIESDPELLTGKLINDVNRWYKGDDSIDIDVVRKTLDMMRDRAEDIKLEYFDPPDDIWLSWKERVTKAADWARGLDRSKIEPSKGTKLYSGIPLDEASKKIFDKVKRVLKPTSKPSEPFIKPKVKEIVLGRRSNLNLANYETNKFINSVEQKLNYTQREAVPFVIEGTEVPKELGRPDLQKVINKHGDLLKGVAEEVKQHFNEGWQKIKKHVPDLSVKQIEDYVTHLWEVPKHKRAEAVSWFQTQNRFLEKRFIDTYKEGIEKGFRPKVLDISEIIRIHDAVSNRSIENTKYINSLLRLKDQGMYLIQRTGTAPMEWIEVDYPALTRRIPLPKKQAGKKGEFVKELKVRVHPDLVRPLKAIFEQRFDHPVISAYEALNGILKKSMLTVSLFHHGALGETGVALIGPGKTAKIMFDPVKIYKALAKGEYDIFSKEIIARDSIEHGVQYGATADIPVGKIQGYLNDLAKATENKVMVGKLMKFLKNSNSLWDKALWNYLHDTLKLYGYEALVSKLNPNMGPEATKMAKREIGQLINDTFGGQNWDTLMMTPKEVQMMTWSLLSADWTLSTTRQALSPTGIGAVYKETANMRKKMGAMFWARAAIYFGVGINALNTLFRSYDMKENPQYYKGRDYTWIDKTMFGNSVGRKTRLFVGRYKDGSERYLKWGKQFSDFFELLTSPLEKIGGKAAPIPGLISEIGDIEKHGRKNIDIALDVGKKLIEAPIPFALRRMMRDKVEFKPSDVFMPSSKGMTRYRAIEYFKLALIDKDYDRVREVYENCLRNNLAPSQLLQGASSWIEHEIMAEVAKDVEDIKDAEMKLHMSSSAYDKRRYGIILRRLHKEKADKEAGLKHMESAIEKIKVLNSLGKDRAPKLHGR